MVLYLKNTLKRLPENEYQLAEFRLGFYQHECGLHDSWSHGWNQRTGHEEKKDHSLGFLLRSVPISDAYHRVFYLLSCYQLWFK